MWSFVSLVFQKINPDSVAKHYSYFVSTSCTRSHKATTAKHNEFHKKENNGHVAPHTERQIKDKSYVSMYVSVFTMFIANCRHLRTNMEETQQNGTVNDVSGIWSVNKDGSIETSVETDQTGTIADSLHRYFMTEKQKQEGSANVNTDLKNDSQGVENIAFLRRWLVVPITILYFGAYVTSSLNNSYM